jgi:hypothetical protein
MHMLNNKRLSSIEYDQSEASEMIPRYTSALHDVINVRTDIHSAGKADAEEKWHDHGE